MTEAIRTDGLVKTFGRTRALDGLDLTVGGRRGARPARAQRRRARPPPSGCCSACCAPTRGQVRVLGGDPWRDAVGCTAAWPTCPAM